MAERYFRQAVSLAPERADAVVGLATALQMQQRNDQARPHFERALALAPGNAPIQLDYGNFIQELALDADEQQSELLEQARRHYVEAWKLAPEIPETYAMYGATFLPRGQKAASCTPQLERAYELLPSNTQILAGLAACAVANGDRERAERLIDRIVAWSHTGKREDAARKRMQRLVERYAR